jgi:DNA-binding response OmpR family regulator
MRRFYKKVFEDEGFKVKEAENGHDGWTLAYETMPDLIVLDLLLPDYHGLDILKKIRADDFTQDIPVIVLTTLKEINDIQKAINMGANYYSVKGTDSPDKLLNMIYKLLKISPPSLTTDINQKIEKQETIEDDLEEDIGDDDIEFLTDD